MSINKINAGNKGLGTLSEVVGEAISMDINPEASGLIVNLLTDLYTDPIGAAIRETMSNAIDSYIDGESKDIEVTVPTFFEPVFVVQDHGSGMTRAQVEENYTQYGNSEKSNDFTKIGAYGLGAKSPLAYCDSFTVETTRDGITTTATLNRSGGKIFAVVNSVETGLESGTKVTIPVNPSDAKHFEKKFDKYKNVPLDGELIVNGTKVDTSKDWVVYDDNFIIDTQSGTTSRIFIKKAEISGGGGGFSGSASFSYLIGGMAYNSSSGRFSRLVDETNVNFLVELKPGCVDFTSARDAIVENNRLKELNRRVQWATNFIEGDGSYQNLLKLAKVASGLSLGAVSTLVRNISLGSKLAKLSKDGLITPTGDIIEPSHFGELESEAKILFADDSGLNSMYLASNHSDRSVMSVVNTYHYGCTLSKTSKASIISYARRKYITPMLYVAFAMGKVVGDEKESKVLVIEGAGDKALEKIINGSKNLISEYGAKDLLVLVVRDGINATKNLQTIADGLHVNLVVESSDSILSMIASNKKKAAIDKKSVTTKDITSVSGVKYKSEWLLTGYDNFNAEIARERIARERTIRSRKPNEPIYGGFTAVKGEADIREIMDNGDIIVAKGTALSQFEAIAGAINSGMNLKGKTVYFESKLSTSIHKILVNYEFMLYPKTFIPTKELVGLFEHKVYGETAIAEVLNNNASDICGNVIANTFGVSMGTQFVEYAINSGRLDVNLETLFKEVEASAILIKYGVAATPSFSDLHNVTGLNYKITLAKAIIDLTKLRDSDNVDEVTLYSYVSRVIGSRISEKLSRYDSIFFEDILTVIIDNFNECKDS